MNKETKTFKTSWFYKFFLKDKATVFLFSRLILSLALLLPTLFIENKIATLVLSIISFVIVGYEIVYECFKKIVHLSFFNESFLMTVASIGAFIIGDYKEAILVMFFFSLGEYLEDYATEKSINSVTSLIKGQETAAHLLRNNESIIVDYQDLLIDDVIEVYPGEMIPTDGVVQEGITDINLSKLTGESLPKTVKVGDTLLSGSINLNSAIKIKVSKRYQDSTLAKILELITDENQAPSKTVSFVNKFSKFYTPIVLFLALLVFLIPSIMTSFEGYQEYLHRALSFLVISCPCALVISVPLTFFTGLGKASSKGILIKGSKYLELLTKVDCLATDKTGTLTTGEFVVTSYSSKEVLELAAILDSKNTHPLSLALQKAVPTNKSYLLSNDSIIKGEGVKGTINNVTYLLGKKSLFVSASVPNIEAHGNQVLYLGTEKEYLGYIILEDEIKKEAPDFINALKLVGIKKSILISGDSKSRVTEVAETLKLDEFHAEVLPQNKVSLIKETELTNPNLAYVGDGTNDAPSLVAANLGIAMGGIGSDAAIESADIVIMNDNLDKIILAKLIAIKTKTIILENISLILLVKSSILLLSALGILDSMVFALIADVGILLLSILNSFRVFYFNPDKKISKLRRKKANY